MTLGSAGLTARATCYDVLVKRGLLARAAIAAALFTPLSMALCRGADAGYADPQACAACHSTIAASYARTGMGRSFYKPAALNTPSNTVEDYRVKNSFYHAASDTHFTMLERSGKYYQRRYQIGEDGKESNVDEKQIDFVMGSGNHVRTYLHRTPQGALQELPLAWYAERGGYWAMNPGYDTPIQPNSRRKITYECMFCHNAYPEIPPGHDQLRAEPIFTGTMPEGIDCQRCHGPGQRHVELARGPRPSAEAVRAAIVNPARLTADRQMEVCAQCHLETDSFPFPHSILRYDRGPFSYRPGEPLADFMLFFDHASPPATDHASPPATDHAPSNPPDDRFQIVNSVYRLRMSACFLKTEGKLTCTTCHDPHEAKRTSDGYNAICRECHSHLSTQVTSHRGAAAPDCIVCHMPKRRTEDVVHAVMTDHFIQRQKPERDLLAEIPEPHGPGIIYHGEVVSYALEGLSSLGKLVRTPVVPAPEDALYLALAQVREDNNPNGLAQFAAAVERFRPAQAGFYVELADAFVKAGKPGNAIPLYREALRRKPDSLAAALGLGDAFEKSNDEASALDAFQQAARTNPADAGAWLRLGEAQMKLGRTGEAVASSVIALQKSLELDPEVPETHYALASVFSQQTAQPGAAGSNDNGRAEASYREAIRLQPDYSAAHMNLAILLFRGNRAGEARDHFESAIRYRPEYGLGHYNFGLMLIAQNRFDEARRQMELAVEYGATLDSKTREAARQRLSELRGRR
jgi:tetratricopeptide (TPR) repeat protein